MAFLQISFAVPNQDKAKIEFKNIERAIGLKEAFTEIQQGSKEYPGFESYMRGRFRTEGAFEGEAKWAELSEKYGRWKAWRYPGKTILRATDLLFHSFEKGQEGNVTEITDTQLTMGSSVPYGIFHQFGYQYGSTAGHEYKMPARPELVISPQERERWKQIIKANIKKKIKEATKK